MGRKLTLAIATALSKRCSESIRRYCYYCGADCYAETHFRRLGRKLALAVATAPSKDCYAETHFWRLGRKLTLAVATALSISFRMSLKPKVWMDSLGFP